MRSVVVVGQGKVGSALARAARAARLRVSTSSARRLPSSLRHADLVIIASRDGEIERVARDLSLLLKRPTSVAHCSGSIGPDALALLRDGGHAVAAMHPLASFAHAPAAPSLEGAALVVTGDERARRACVRFGRAIGMRPVSPERLDPAAYHAAAALVANGAAALAAAATALLDAAGIPEKLHGALLGPLLRSVAENVSKLGPKTALTGPVRRGDAAAVRKHLAAADPVGVGALYRALALAQIPVAAGLGDASHGALEDLRALLQGADQRKP